VQRTEGKNKSGTELKLVTNFVLNSLKGLSERELKSNSSQIHSHFHFHFHFAKTPSGMAKGGSERLGTAREVGSMR